MNSWKLEKNMVIAIKVERIFQIFSCLKKITDFIFKKIMKEKTQTIIQMKILTNQIKFNKKLIFQRINGVGNKYKIV